VFCKALYSLTDPQCRKLQIAGRGDIAGYFDRVEDLKRRQVDKPLSDDGFKSAQHAIYESSIQKQEALFDEGSLFCKVLHTLLTPEQVANHEREMKLALIDRVLSVAPPKFAQLSPESRQLIAKTLVSANSEWAIGTSYDREITLLLCRESANAIQRLISKDEWKSVQQLINEASAEEQDLRRLGLWPISSKAVPQRP